MELSSGSVSLRALETDDLERVIEQLAGPAVWGMRGLRNDRLGPMSRAEIMAQIEGWPKREHGQVLVIEVDGAAVGHVQLDWGWDAISPDLSVFVAPDHRRRGHGSVAARLAIDWLFDHMPTSTVQSWVAEPVEGAVAFAESLGFKPVGRVRRVGIKEGAYFDAIPLQILREEWGAAHAG